MKKNLFIYFGIAALVLILSLIVFFKQAEFTSPYNSPYWKDRFDHSQWSLPVSRRDIGDDGIYAYAGYRLMHGASIEETNSNKPPVGIYIIGVSISVFNNPNILIFVTGVLSLLVFYFLVKNFIEDVSLSLLTVVMLAVNPMFFSYMWIPLLDLIQTFFLLCHVLAITYFIKYKKYSLISIVLAGVFLGLFTETKPPILTIFILLIEFGYLLFKRKFAEIVAGGIGFGVAVLIPYIRYFQLGHSIIDYLKLHKYMASIYYEGKNQVYRTGLLQAILVGRFPDTSSGVSVPDSEWWIMVPIIWVGGFFAAIRSLFTKPDSIILKGISIFTLLTFIFFSNVSSYPRYLLVLLPFIILLFTIFLLKIFSPTLTKVVLSLAIIIGLLNMYVFLQPNPDDTLSRFYYNFSDGFFQDIYQENLVNPQDTHMSREEFRKRLVYVFHQAGITSVKFNEERRSFSGDTGKVIVDETYYTQDLGTFIEKKTIQLKKVKEKWGVVWDWNYVLNGYQPGDTFSKEIIPGKRGTIYSDGHIFAQDTLGYLISIDPSKIDLSRENEMLLAISQVTNYKLTHIDGAVIHNTYTENPISGITYPIATNFYQMTNAQIKQLQSFPGVIITPHEVRLYDSLIFSLTIGNTAYTECCTRIYSPYSYHGVKGIEQKYDRTLSGANGGSLVMKNIQGDIVRTIIKKSPVNGHDIKINSQ